MPAYFRQLTQRRINALKPGERLIEAGLECLCLVSGAVQFTLDKVVHGQRIHRRLGRTSEGKSLADVERQVLHLIREAQEGTLRLPKGRRLELTVARAAAQYLARLGTEGGKDLPRKRQRLTQHVLPALGKRTLAELKLWHLQRYRADRQRHGASQATIDRELAALSHLLTMAVEWGWLPHRPFRITFAKHASTRTTYLTVEQSARLLEAARMDRNPHIYLFCLIGLHSGMRTGEILAMRWEDIDGHRRMVYIPVAKAGAREQPVTQSLLRYLGYGQDGQRYGGESGWLFPSRSTSGHLTAIKLPFRRVVAAAGLDPTEVVRHTLRHTFGSHLAMAGVDVLTIQRLMGHHSLRMVQRYAHIGEGHVQAALERLERRYQTGEGA